MTYCKHKPVFCECQPDEGTPCPYAPNTGDAELRALVAKARGTIIGIAAELATGQWLLSEYRQDHAGMVTRATIQKIEAQNEAAKVRALRLREAADSLNALPALLDRLAAAELDAERMRQLFVKWWMKEMDDCHYFNEVVRDPVLGARITEALDAARVREK